MDRFSKTLSEFTAQARDIIKKSISVAQSFGAGYVGSEHILLAIFEFSRSAAAFILKRHGVLKEEVSAVLKSSAGTFSGAALTEKSFTKNASRAISESVNLAKSMGSAKAGSEHLLMLLVRDERSGAAAVLNELNVSSGEIYADCAGIGISSAESRGRSKTGALEKYGVELTSAKAQKRLDSCFEREEQIEQISRILLRRRKNNPCLIGEAGVGKSAIVEGLAKLIYEGNAPEELCRKRIFRLDLSLLLAGAKYRGDFEQRFKDCLSEASDDNGIILFIDEIHSIMGTGAAEGAIDAASILKPKLARGSIQLIGATTYDEYRSFIEKDAALDRRFARVFVNEPSEKQTKNILLGIKPSYESFHGIKITEAAIDEAIRVSERYISNRYFPDKAIDLIDEACSFIRMGKKPDDCDSFNRYILGEITREEYLSEISRKSALTLTDSHVRRLASLNLGIPVDKLSETEQHRLQAAADKVKAKLFGQDAAVDEVMNAVKRSRLGADAKRGVIGSFLFVGQSGVGKTALCEYISEEIFGSGSLIRFDMSEFSSPHTIARLIGAPAGYVGYEKPGELCEKVRRKPYSVVLFDEIEKAHRDIFNLLLQVLDTGFLEDSKGVRVSFKNTLIVLTANLGCSSQGSVGFLADAADKERARAKSAAAKFFSPELLGRLDALVYFPPLSDKSMEKIAAAELSALCGELKAKGIELDISSRVMPFLLEKSADLKESGARGVIKLIRNDILGLVTDEVFAHGAGGIRLTVTDGKLNAVNITSVLNI